MYPFITLAHTLLKATNVLLIHSFFLYLDFLMIGRGVKRLSCVLSAFTVHTVLVAHVYTECI